MRTKPFAINSGVTLIEVFAMVVVLSAVFLVLTPGLGSKKCRGYGPLGCLANLRNIGLGFQTFAADFDGKYPWQVDEANGGVRLPLSGEAAGVSNNLFVMYAAISNEISTTKIIQCPCDRNNPRTTYSAGLTQGISIASFPSYFLGTTASAANPRSILAGDRRLLLYSAGMDERTTNHYNRVVQIKRNDVFGVKNANINWMPEWHQGRANLLLQDGSVMRCNPGPLRRTLREAFQPDTAGFDLFLPAL